jgi:Cutinase
VDALPGKLVRTTSLRYQAAPVSELAYNNGEGFYLSMKAGHTALVRRVRQIVGRCERSRIALIGYSQGAAVVSEALRRLIEHERARSAIRAVILYAGPYSAGANSTYDMTFTPAGAPRLARSARHDRERWRSGGSAHTLEGPFNSGNGVIGGIAGPLGLYLAWILGVGIWWLVQDRRAADGLQRLR